MANAMSPAPSIADSHAIDNALQLAGAVVRKLTEQGVYVIAAMANGRRPLLRVDRMPEGVTAVVKRSHPNGMGGIRLVQAAEYMQCQLEWMYDLPTTPKEVAHE